MKARAVLFDLDGTLVDTIEDIAICMNRVLHRKGETERDVDTYRRSVGWGIRALVERLLPGADEQYVDQLAREMRVEYNANPVMKSEAYPGIPELLDLLWKRRVPTAVLSNKADEITQQVVGSLFPEHGFSVVAGAVDGVAKKPDPDSTLRLIESLGIRAEEWLFVGDTAIDMQTAAGAGMVPVGVRWGFRNEDELRAAGARIIISRADEVAALLETREPERS